MCDSTWPIVDYISFLLITVKACNLTINQPGILLECTNSSIKCVCITLKLNRNFEFNFNWRCVYRRFKKHIAVLTPNGFINPISLDSVFRCERWINFYCIPWCLTAFLKMEENNSNEKNAPSEEEKTANLPAESDPVNIPSSSSRQ